MKLNEKYLPIGTVVKLTGQLNRFMITGFCPIEANDENIYMTWILLMPDEPTDEDIEDIAMDDEAYNECFDLFVKLIAKKGNRY